jgi:DNA repair protein RadD
VTASATVVLRPYQLDAVEQIERALGERRKVLLAAPTGAGKIEIASAVIKRWVERHKTALSLAHRREIIQQAAAKLADNGIAHGAGHGIIMAGVEPRPMASVQVASIDTLLVRGVRSKVMALPSADLLVFDEAHRARGRTREQLISLYPNASLLGMTATPCRGDGRGLGNIFDTMIECPQVADLIVGGFLVKSRVYAPVGSDIAAGVQVAKGDYVISQLEGRMNTNVLVGDIVGHWLKYGERRRTICFAVGVGHSGHIRDEFAQFRVRAEHLDGTTPVDQREAILPRLVSGETEIVTNCMVLTEGWNMPAVGCCILARPTRQQGLFRQMISRVLRPADGKPDAIILDHSGAVYRHGLPEDHVKWTLDVDKRAVNPAQAKRDRGEAPKLHECPSCKGIMVKPPCGNCGWQPQPRARAVDVEGGELVLVVAARLMRRGTAKPTAPRSSNSCAQCSRCAVTNAAERRTSLKTSSATSRPGRTTTSHPLLPATHCFDGCAAATSPSPRRHRAQHDPARLSPRRTPLRLAPRLAVASRDRGEMAHARAGGRSTLLAVG